MRCPSLYCIVQEDTPTANFLFFFLREQITLFGMQGQKLFERLLLKDLMMWPAVSFEVRPRAFEFEAADLSAASEALQKRWHSAGRLADTQHKPGPAAWHTWSFSATGDTPRFNSAGCSVRPPY